MHIAVLTHNYPRFPGDFSGTFVEALCEELSTQGQRVTLWAPDDPAYQRRQNDAAPSTVDLRLYRYIWPRRLHRLGYMRSMQSDLALRLDSYVLGPLMMLSGIVHLLRFAQRDRPDVLHAHWLLPNGFIGAVVSRLLGIPLVISVPGSDARVADLNPIFRAMAVFSLRRASLLTANSAELRDAVAVVSSPLAPADFRQQVLDKFDLILYGTDPQALRPDPTGVSELRQQLDIDARCDGNGADCPVVFLCVGRMVYKKGFDHLIRALAEPALRERHVVAVMVGNGDQRAAWQALAEELGVAAQLRWTGNVPADQIRVYYNLCDVLINPAVHRPADGLNVCVLDAMSCAKPVVGSNVQGNPLAIVDGETGLLVPEADPAALAEALATLVDDAALRARMGRSSRARIENELGWPHLARRYIQRFDQLAAQST